MGKKKLGDVLVERGYLTHEQIDEALMIQKQYSTEGMWMYIGQVLIEKGIVNRDQVEEGLEVLRRRSGGEL